LLLELLEQLNDLIVQKLKAEDIRPKFPAYFFELFYRLLTVRKIVRAPGNLC